MMCARLLHEKPLKILCPYCSRYIDINEFYSLHYGVEKWLKDHNGSHM